MTNDHSTSNTIAEFKMTTPYPLQPDYTPLFQDLAVVERKLWRIHKASVSGSLTQQKTSYLLAELGTDLTAIRLLQRRMQQDHEKSLSYASMAPKTPTTPVESQESQE